MLGLVPAGEEVLGTSIQEISDKYARPYGSFTFSLQLKGARNNWKAPERRARKAEFDLQRLVVVVGSTPDSLLLPSPRSVTTAPADPYH